MNKEFESPIRDFIYFDFAKAASIFSQISGGFITEMEARAEETKDERNVRKYALPFFKPEFGGIQTEKTTLLESRVLHHDLYTRIEQFLFNQGYAVDFSSDFNIEDVKKGVLHDKLGDKFYIKAEGWGVIEDYQRLKGLAQKLNNINAFIKQCASYSLEKTPESQELRTLISQKKGEVLAIQDRNKRKVEESKLKKLESKLYEEVREKTGLKGVDDWLLDGIVDFIDTFMPGRINLRLYPFEEESSFHILANLKRDAFVDTDMENVLFAYGTRPNVRLTVFGLITSIPSSKGAPFDPMREFETEAKESSKTDDKVAFEKGFRGVFQAYEGIEQMVRFSRYPNITIYPIAVYRNIKSNAK